jgi:hypothetical protein
LSIGILSLVGLYILGILVHFDINYAANYGPISGPLRTLLLYSIPLIFITCYVGMLAISFCNEYVKLFRKTFLMNIIISGIFPLLFVTGFIGLNIQVLLNGFSGRSEVTEFSLGFNLLALIMLFGFYLWSLRKSYRLNIISRTQLHKSIGIFITGLVIGLVFFGLINGISYLLISNLLVGLSILLLPMQLLPLIVYKQRHQ